MNSKVSLLFLKKTQLDYRSKEDTDCLIVTLTLTTLIIMKYKDFKTLN